MNNFSSARSPSPDRSPDGVMRANLPQLEMNQPAGIVMGIPPKEPTSRRSNPRRLARSRFESRLFADPRRVCAHLAAGDPRRFAGQRCQHRGLFVLGGAAEGLSSAANGLSVGQLVTSERVRRPRTARADAPHIGLDAIHWRCLDG